MISKANKPMDVVYQPSPMETIEGQRLGLEREDLAQKREILASQLGLKQQEQERKGLETQIKQQRADAYEMSITNPEMEFIKYGDGRIIGVNPRSGEKMEFDKDSFTKQNEIDLQTQGRLQVVQEQGAQGRDLERMRQVGREDLQRTGGQQNLAEIAARIKPTPEPSSTQQTAAVKLRANQWISQHPEDAKYIQFDAYTNMPTVIAPGEGGSFLTGKGALTPEHAKEINDAIYGVGGKTVQLKGKETPTATDTKKKSDPLGIRK
jgi:hypothetical protein